MLKMMGQILLLGSILIGSSTLSYGQNKAVDCLEVFYQTKSFKCVEKAIKDAEEKSRQKPKSQNLRHSDIQALVGFLAETFVQYPEIKKKILNKSVSSYMKTIIVEAFYRAGLIEEAKKYAYSNSLKQVFDIYKKQSLTQLSSLKPKLPSDNDLLIGAFMATGDQKYIFQILNNFKSSDKKVIADAFRMGLAMTTFGRSLSPKGRNSQIMQALCKRYECKTNIKKFFHLATLATAYWSLTSLSKRNAEINKALSTFFNKNKKIAAILATEMNNISNYMVLFLASTATSDPAIEKNLKAFEALEEMDISEVLAKDKPSGKK